jgi:Fe-S cluster assembly iron-binding protein IscA
VALEESQNENENDIVAESKGLKIIYEKDFEGYLEDAVVSYSDSWYNAGFTVNGARMSSCK